MGQANSIDDWQRALRYGIGADGRGLVIMPSQHFSKMSDSDLGSLIAHLQAQPQVDNELPPREISFLATVLIGANQLEVAPALIGDSPVPQNISPEPSVEYGEYLTTIATCQDCHASNFAGNTDPNTGPTGPNLTPGGELAGWQQSDFINALTTGETPSSRQLDPEQMPWMYYQFTDEELSAIWLFLESLPALPTNN